MNRDIGRAVDRDLDQDVAARARPGKLVNPCYPAVLDAVERGQLRHVEPERRAEHGLELLARYLRSLRQENSKMPPPSLFRQTIRTGAGARPEETPTPFES